MSTIFNIDHVDGQGQPLTPQEVQFALKLYRDSVKEQDDYEWIAAQIGFQVKEGAKELVAEESQYGSRQIVQRMDEPSVTAYPGSISSSTFSHKGQELSLKSKDDSRVTLARSGLISSRMNSRGKRTYSEPPPSCSTRGWTRYRHVEDDQKSAVINVTRPEISSFDLVSCGPPLLI